MRKNLILLIFISFGAIMGVTINSAPAAAQLRCSSAAPSLSVKTATTRTKYVRTKSAKDLTNMHGGQGATVGGLAGGEIGFKTETRFEVTSQGDKACVKLKNVEVTFYAKPEIHIANNFSRSSCEYNAVVAHEQQHIRILRKFVREYSPKVKQEVRRMSRQIDPAIGPIPTSRVDQAQNKLQKEFIRKIEAYSDKIIPILAKRQKAFDSPAEYARVSSKCKKWDKKLSED